MSGLDALQSVQFITVQGKRFAVLSADDWESLIDWLETVEDIQTVQEARKALADAGGDRNRAGWLEWESVREELE